MSGTLLQSESGTAPGEVPASWAACMAALKAGSTIKSTKAIDFLDCWDHPEGGRGSQEEMCMDASLKLDFRVLSCTGREARTNYSRPFTISQTIALQFESLFYKCVFREEPEVGIE